MSIACQVAGSAHASLISAKTSRHGLSSISSSSLAAVCVKTRCIPLGTRLTRPATCLGDTFCHGQGSARGPRLVHGLQRRALTVPLPEQRQRSQAACPPPRDCGRYAAPSSPAARSRLFRQKMGSCAIWPTARSRARSPGPEGNLCPRARQSHCLLAGQPGAEALVQFVLIVDPERPVVSKRTIHVARAGRHVGHHVDPCDYMGRHQWHG